MLFAACVSAADGDTHATSMLQAAARTDVRFARLASMRQQRITRDAPCAASGPMRIERPSKLAPGCGVQLDRGRVAFEHRRPEHAARARSTPRARSAAAGRTLRHARRCRRTCIVMSGCAARQRQRDAERLRRRANGCRCEPRGCRPRGFASPATRGRRRCDVAGIVARKADGERCALLRLCALGRRGFRRGVLRLHRRRLRVGRAARARSACRATDAGRSPRAAAFGTEMPTDGRRGRRHGRRRCGRRRSPTSRSDGQRAENGRE